MADFGDEISLLVFVSLNLAVFGCAWSFTSRRVTASRSQAILDAALLGYAVQYVAIGAAGFFHCLMPGCVEAIAGVLSSVLFIASLKAKRIARPKKSLQDRMAITAVALFAISIIMLYAKSQASLPVISNDALTYHFPAAVQWLQQRKISLFQTWFFNPANTYSPLAGSMFIVWMIIPFGGDVMARFVEVPPLICIGIAMYRLCREMQVRVRVAAIIAGAAVLSRPIFLPCMMGKDDLFVAFFFLASLVALSPPRSQEKWGQVRFGLALGLLMATKYTALLSVPILLLAIDAPRWSWRRWSIAIAIVALLAGPWYLRNWLATGNPIFPMYSLFTSARSDVFHAWPSAIAVVIGGAYGLPLLLALPLVVGCLYVLTPRRRFLSYSEEPDSTTPDPALRSTSETGVVQRMSHPISRACVLGIIPGLVLFFMLSPFPEVRFVLPIFLMLFGACALAIDRCSKRNGLVISLALLLLAAAVATLFASQFLSIIAGFAAIGLLIALLGSVAVWWGDDRRLRWQAIVAIMGIIAFVYAYINWGAYCRNYRQTLFDEGTGYAIKYPALNQLWRTVNQHIPADATVAYTNMYLVYPLQGDQLRRRLVYAPSRAGVHSLADLGWLGSNLSGEKLVPAAIHATVASPDRSAWLANLQATGAQYLIIGKIGNGGVIDHPPEAEFVRVEPQNFAPLFDGEAGTIYQIK